MPRYLRLSDVARLLGVEDALLHELARLELIHPKHTIEGEPLLDERGCDELRVALLLHRELDVNLAGVQVILHMRRRLIDMNRQMDEIFEHLRDELRRELRSADFFGPRGLLGYQSFEPF